MEHLAHSNFARPGNAIRAVSMNPRWSNCSFSLLRHRCSIKVRSDNLHPVLGGLAIHPTRRWKLRALPSIDSTCSAAAAAVAEAVRSKYVNQRLSSSPSTTTTTTMLLAPVHLSIRLDEERLRTLAGGGRRRTRTEGRTPKNKRRQPIATGRRTLPSRKTVPKSATALCSFDMARGQGAGVELALGCAR